MRLSCLNIASLVNNLVNNDMYDRLYIHGWKHSQLKSRSHLNSGLRL